MLFSFISWSLLLLSHPVQVNVFGLLQKQFHIETFQVLLLMELILFIITAMIMGLAIPSVHASCGSVVCFLGSPNLYCCCCKGATGQLIAIIIGVVAIVLICGLGCIFKDRIRRCADSDYKTINPWDGLPMLQLPEGSLSLSFFVICWVKRRWKRFDPSYVAIFEVWITVMKILFQNGAIIGCWSWNVISSAQYSE